MARRRRNTVLGLAALVAVVGTSGCVWSGEDDAPRTVNGRVYSTQPVEANVGPHRFRFPANLYYNQIGPSADGGVMLAVFWPGLNAAPPGDHPVRSVEDGYRQVTVELHYLGPGRVAEYLERRAGTERVIAVGGPRLAHRLAMPAWRGLTPYAMDRSRVDRAAWDVAPDWYVVRDGNERVRTFISCDSREYMPDGLMMENARLVRSSGDRVAMCRHSLVDEERGLAVEMSYARVLLVDWARQEGLARALVRRHEAPR